jgi:hypothetical protein
VPKCKRLVGLATQARRNIAKVNADFHDLRFDALSVDRGMTDHTFELKMPSVTAKTARDKVSSLPWIAGR